MPEIGRSPSRLRRMARAVLCMGLCAALLGAGGCGLSVKPKGQVATGISIGR